MRGLRGLRRDARASRTAPLVAVLGLLAVLAGATASAPAGEPDAERGVFALQDASPTTAAYLTATPQAGDPLALALNIRFANASDGRPIAAFDVDMTKRLHLIAVSDDFKIFLHVHPTLGPNGHFTIVERFPKAGLYHVYADCVPHGHAQQVFRFDVTVLAAGGPPGRDLAPTGNVASAGSYRVSLDRTTLDTNGETHLVVHVRENGRPATDLHPYLGALAHAVFLNARDLTYVHVHPMKLGAQDDMAGMSEMSGMSGRSMPGMNMSAPPLPDSAISAPDMLLHVAVHEPGTYKLWLQFRGGGALHVAPFVLTAR